MNTVKMMRFLSLGQGDRESRPWQSNSGIFLCSLCALVQGPEEQRNGQMDHHWHYMLVCSFTLTVWLEDLYTSVSSAYLHKSKVFVDSFLENWSPLAVHNVKSRIKDPVLNWWDGIDRCFSGKPPFALSQKDLPPYGAHLTYMAINSCTFHTNIS